MIADSTVLNIISEVRPYTMAPPGALALTIHSAITAIEIGLKGDLVECGVWRGGSSFAMLLAQRVSFGRVIKPVWMFDSFEGLPPVDVRDGPAAAKYQSTPDAPDYFDNCRASLEEALMAIRKFGFSSSECLIAPGWFETTYEEHLADLKLRGIALLRIDCDWYESVKLTFDKMEPIVAENGIIIVDDYFTWDGCARATHDYLSRNDLPYRIKSGAPYFGAWMVKQSKGKPAV